MSTAPLPPMPTGEPAQPAPPSTRNYTLIIALAVAALVVVGAVAYAQQSKAEVNNGIPCITAAGLSDMTQAADSVGQATSHLQAFDIESSVQDTDMAASLWDAAAGEVYNNPPVVEEMHGVADAYRSAGQYLRDGDVQSALSQTEDALGHMNAMPSDMPTCPVGT